MTTREERPAEGGFIEELHGVRGIALALVVLFHLFGQGRVSGGVDVFLFFSGFLLTASMYRRSVQRSKGRVVRHYTRTLLRLFPAALVVLAGVTVAVLLWRPLTDQPQDLREIRASLLYYENWELIRSQLAYGAAGPDASVVQHFWSLSLQGQFFLVWPLLVVALVAVGRRVGRPWLVTLLGTGALTLAGFVTAQVMVRADQQVAYFHGLSRWWELTLGGVLALVLMRWRPGGRLLPGLGWAGLALILASGFVVDGAHAFPGPWVLLPLGGAALVLVAAGAARGPRRLLRTRPLTWLADIAYELYLWHWPILVVLLSVQGRDVVGPRSAVMILAVSVVAAWLTHRLVSVPALRARTWRPRVVLAPAVTVACVGAVLLTSGAVRVDDQVERALNVSAYTVEDYPGAEAVRDPGTAQDDYSLPVGPPLDVAARDTEPGMGSKCWQNHRGDAKEVQWCDGPEGDGPTVLLVGGSRGLMWQPMVMAAGERQDWTVRATSRGSCPLQVDAEKQGCRDWNEDVLSQILQMRPEAVVVEGTEIRPLVKGGGESLDPHQVAAWRRLADAGIQVLAMRAGPRYVEGPPACIERVGRDGIAECNVAMEDLFADTSPFADVVGEDDSVHEVDLTRFYCPDGTCSVLIGNLVSFRDRRHFSAAFARTLAPAFEDAIEAVAPSLLSTRPAS